MGFCMEKMRKVGPVKIIQGFVAGVTIATLFALLFGKLVQLLWNSTVADIFTLADISYWQAVKLLLLTRILVGGMGHGPKGHHHMKDKWHRRGREILEKKAAEED